MKILVTGRGCDTLRRHELGLFENDQARALLAAGHDVRYAAIDTRSPKSLRPWGVREYVLDGLPVVYCALPGLNFSAELSGKVQAAAVRMIWERLERDNWLPDIVHSHFSGDFFRVARGKGVPFVYTEHHSIAGSAELPADELRREKELYSEADVLLCVSEALSETIARHTGVQARVVHNVADIQTFALPHRKEGGEFCFAAAGNLIHRKGYDLLLDALAKLRERGYAPKLVILGDGKERESLEKQCAALGLHEQVTFLGRKSRKEMAETYRDADAFVLPSRLETFGVVYIEAMAAGLPVIATVCGGPENFVREDNGILIPPEDITSLTDAMEQMIKNYHKYNSAAIAAYARESFAPETIAAELEEIYKTLL